MDVGTICIADYDNVADANTTETELLFDVNETIIFLSGNNGDDWWYGHSLKSGLKGWYDPRKFHCICPPLVGNVYQSMPLADIQQNQKNILKDMLINERDFIVKLKDFIEIVTSQLLKRDTPFKKRFMAIHSVSICINSLREMYVGSHKLFNSLKSSCSNDTLAKAYEDFLPVFHLYIQYIKECVHVLQEVKIYQIQLHELLSVLSMNLNSSVESIFIAPLKYARLFYAKLELYVQFTIMSFMNKSANKIGLHLLATVLSKYQIENNIIQESLSNEEYNLFLLNLQSRFINNVEVFRPNRKLVKEGILEKLQITTGLSKTPQTSVSKVYIHLFTDCLLYSSFKREGDTTIFKLQKSISLSDYLVYIAPRSEKTFGFRAKASIVTDINENQVLFHDKDAYHTSEWIETIQKVIELINIEINSVTSPQDTQNTIKDAAILPKGLDKSKLGKRAFSVLKFLQMEIPFLEFLSRVCTIMVHPLLDIIHNGSITNASFLGGNSLTKYQTQHIVDILRSDDIKMYLLSIVKLSDSLGEFISSLQLLCNNSNWGENVRIGTIFNSKLGMTLYQQYYEYTSSKFVALPYFIESSIGSITSSSHLLSFFKEAQNKIFHGKSNNLIEKLNIIAIHIENYIKFLNDLKSVTSSADVDYQDINKSLTSISTIIDAIRDLISKDTNHKKLLEIQSSFNRVAPNTSIPSILTTDIEHSDNIINIMNPKRKFLKEGELKKVCRKKNKIFHFWLFNDSLMYGSSNSLKTYTFHRYVDLNKTNITIHKSDDLKYAFEIHSTEKSFIVLASNEKLYMEWFKEISDAIKLLRPNIENVLVTAPLWIPDTVADGCSICKIGFNIFRRRHHCRKCGALVCGNDSKNSMILRHIHLTKAQRVCNICYDTNDNSTYSYDVSSNSSQRINFTHENENTIESNISKVNEVNEDLDITQLTLEDPNLSNTHIDNNVVAISASKVKKEVSTIEVSGLRAKFENLRSSDVVIQHNSFTRRRGKLKDAIAAEQSKSDTNTSSETSSLENSSDVNPFQQMNSESPNKVEVSNYSSSNSITNRYQPSNKYSSPSSTSVLSSSSNNYNSNSNRQNPPPPPRVTSNNTANSATNEKEVIVPQNNSPPKEVRRTSMNDSSITTIEDRAASIPSNVEYQDVKVSNTPTISNSGGLFASLNSVKLRPSKPIEPKPKPVTILDEIQKGAKLRAIPEKDLTKSNVATTSNGGILDTLAVEMFRRRIHLKQEQESDSSGFSDSDSDDD